MRKWLRRIVLFGCLPVLVLALLGGFVIWRMVLWQPASTVPPPPTPEQTARAEAKQEVIREEIEAVREAQRERRPRQFNISLTEEEINTILRSNAEIQQMLKQYQLKNVAVGLRNGEIEAAAEAPGPYKMQVFVTATGRVVATPDGKLKYETKDVRIGQMPAPPALHERLDNYVQVAVNQLNKQLKVHVEAVTVSDHALTVTGATSTAAGP